MVDKLRVLFVCSGRGKAGMSPFIKAQGESIMAAGVQLDYFTIKKRGLKGYWSESVRLREHLKQNKYEILHAHYGMSALAALIARRKEKLIVSFMGDDIVGTNKENGKVTKGSLLLARLNALLAEIKYDHAIVKSPAMLLRMKKADVSLLPNGVDLTQFKPLEKAAAKAKLGISPEQKIVIFVSDPSRTEKNYSLAQNAMNLLEKPHLRLLSVFDLPHDVLPDYYNAAELLLLTSFHEGSPNVIKEAMACNCPVVSTDVGDVSWVLGDTAGCFLTSFKAEDVAQKLEKALSFAENEGRTNGRQRLLALGLNSEVIAKRIMQIYEKVLA